MRNFTSAQLPQRILLPLSLPQNGGLLKKTIDNNGLRNYDYGSETQASVAQLDRASVFGTEGWGFESLRACFMLLLVWCDVDLPPLSCGV